MIGYQIGILGQGGPAIACCRDDEGVRETIRHLPPGQYWIARDRVACGLAWVFSPREWSIECDHWSAGPGWIII